MQHGLVRGSLIEPAQLSETSSIQGEPKHLTIHLGKWSGWWYLLSAQRLMCSLQATWLSLLHAMYLKKVYRHPGVYWGARGSDEQSYI